MGKSDIVFRIEKAKTTIIFLILSVFLLLMSPVAYTEDVKKLMIEADELYSQRDNLHKAKEAYLKYKEIIKIDAENFDAHWKLAQTIWYIGEFSSEMKKEEKMSMFEEGIKAIEIAPQRAEGYFWLGVMYGLYGEARGIMSSLFLVDDMREALNKAAAIDPTVAGGGPHRVLGRMYYKLPGFFGGCKKKSLEYLLKSKQICPTAPLTYIFLADTYLALKNKDLAKRSLEELINMSHDPRWIPETKRYKEIAKEMLKKIR